VNDIQETPTEELLCGLELGKPTPRQIWDRWLKEEPICPGQTRVRALDLYSAYLTWCFIKGRENTGEPLTLTAFGTLMGAKFQRSSGRMGTYYLISKSSNPSIPQYVMKQITPKPPG
jgi:hypothetical protein